MQYDLLWPDLISYLWSNIDLDILRLNWVSFDLSRREQHNGGKTVALGHILLYCWIGHDIFLPDIRVHIAVEC